MYHDRIRFVGGSGPASGPGSGSIGTPSNPRGWQPGTPGGDAPAVLWEGACCVQDDVETVRKAVEASRSGRESTPADALVFLPRPLYRHVLRLLDGVLGTSKVTCLVKRLGDTTEIRAYVERTSRTDGTVLIRFA